MVVVDPLPCVCGECAEVSVLKSNGGDAEPPGSEFPCSTDRVIKSFAGGDVELGTGTEVVFVVVFVVTAFTHDVEIVDIV